MCFLPVVTVLEASVHAPFASECGRSKLVFWLDVVFPSWISGSVVCSPFIAASAKQRENEPELLSVNSFFRFYLDFLSLCFMVLSVPVL